MKRVPNSPAAWVIAKCKDLVTLIDIHHLSGLGKSSTTRYFPWKILPHDAAASEVKNKDTKNKGSGKPGQPGLGLHQRSFSKGAVSEKKALPQVSQMHPSVVLLARKVKVTKEMRFAQHCVAAASQLLTPQQTSALKNAGMQRVFAALRAPVHVNFQFKDYIPSCWGLTPEGYRKCLATRKLFFFFFLHCRTSARHCRSTTGMSEERNQISPKAKANKNNTPTKQSNTHKKPNQAKVQGNLQTR